MNNVTLEGRLVETPRLSVRDPETTTKPKCQFRIAVPRKYKKEGRPDADFINCVTYDQPAVFLARHGRKGGRISLQGRLVSGFIDQEDGTRYFYTKVVAGDVWVFDYREDSETVDDKPAFDPENSDDFYSQIPDPSDVPFLNS